LNQTPAIIAADNCPKLPEHDWRFLETELLRPAQAASCARCRGCDELAESQQLFSPSGTPHTYLCCPECGPSEIDPRLLRRWRIDVPSCLRLAFTPIITALKPTELLADQLWRIGRPTIHGRRWELVFARHPDRDRDDAVLKLLAQQPASAVIAPLEADATAWSQRLPNICLALEAFTALDAGALSVDANLFAELLAQRPTSISAKLSPRRRRADFAGKIDRLRDVLKEHVKAARDHALDSQARTGTPELLPFPTNRWLAKQAGIRNYEVTRCFQDKEARELQFLREVAQDLNRLLGMPVSKVCS
jgi:hypothetical protein